MEQSGDRSLERIEKMAELAQQELFLPGQHFGGYEVVQRLGKGGMGFVYLVSHPEYGLFAVKIIDPQAVAKDPEYVARFAHEGDFAMNIRHSNLIAVHEMGQDPDTGYYFLVMDYLPGGDVHQRLKNGPFAIDEAVRIVAQVANALVEVHSHGVIHRDIKPENIMFTADGTPKLADLGIAKFSDAGESIQTSADVMIGTPAYMAPEQIMDSHGVDARADIFSLGVVFFEMLTGHRPNEGLKVLEIVAQALEGRPIPDVRTFRPEVPATVAQLLNMMCAPKREQRFASAAQVVDVFNRLLGRERNVASVAPPPVVPSSASPSSKMPSLSSPSSSSSVRSSSVRSSAVRSSVVGRRSESGWKSFLRQQWVFPAGVTAGIAVLAAIVVFLGGRSAPRRRGPVMETPKVEIVPLVPESAPESGEAERSARQVTAGTALENRQSPREDTPAAGRSSATQVRAESVNAETNRLDASLQTSDSSRKSPPKTGDGRVFWAKGGARVEMVYCAPCTFRMGSPKTEPGRGSDEQPHEVTLTRGFWIGKYEVTREQWRQVMGVNAPGVGAGDHPVAYVSWADCQRFMSRAGDGFRLPTEAEWECACRAGSTGAFAGGRLADLAWYLGSLSPSGDVCHPVGKKNANDWGIHDMHGNVWEWCADWYGDYPSGAVDDPKGPDAGEYRVMRGGWAKSLDSKCRSAVRRSASPQERSRTCGFRLCRWDE